MLPETLKLEVKVTRPVFLVSPSPDFLHLAKYSQNAGSPLGRNNFLFRSSNLSSLRPSSGLQKAPRRRLPGNPSNVNPPHHLHSMANASRNALRTILHRCRHKGDIPRVLCKGGALSSYDCSLYDFVLYLSLECEDWVLVVFQEDWI